MTLERDDIYFELVAQSLRVCAQYRPKFGTGGSGLTSSQFQWRYGADPFYHWVGLDSPLIYAAHKAAGGMTSIYRQLGIGGERLFRQIIQDQLGLSASQAGWSYRVPAAGGKERTLTLDGRIEFDDVQDAEKRNRVETWVDRAASQVGVGENFRSQARGVVFEVRQGYKSADSKRQNADMANAASAYSSFYIPSLALLSTQINEAVALRYAAARWLLLTGTIEGSATESTYVFCAEVLGFDLASFFERNADRFRTLVEGIVESLLRADDG